MPVSQYPAGLRAASLYPIGTAANLNLRFKHGNNDAPPDLYSAGVLLHQFDFMDDPGVPARTRPQCPDLLILAVRL